MAEGAGASRGLAWDSLFLQQGRGQAGGTPCARAPGQAREQREQNPVSICGEPSVP